MNQYKKNGWNRSSEAWMRIVQRRGKPDEEGNPTLDITEEPVVRYKSTCTNNDGSEIACYATSERVLEGLERLHVHAMR